MDQQNTDQDKQQQKNKNQKSGGQGEIGNKSQNNNNKGQQHGGNTSGGNKLQKNHLKNAQKQENDSNKQQESNQLAPVRPQTQQTDEQKLEQVNQTSKIDNQVNQDQKQQGAQKKQQHKQGDQTDEDHQRQNDQNKAKKDDKPSGVCRLFKAGKCFYGDKCKFRHGKVKVGLDKLCKLFIDQGKCKFDKKCHFVHMTVEEWEQKYRYSKTNQKNEDVDSSSDEGIAPEEEEKDDFEYKSKMQLKKEKQKRLAGEHQAHKEHVQKTQNEKNPVKQISNSVPQVKDTKVPGVEYFDVDAYMKELNEEQGNEQNQQKQKAEEEEKKEKPWFDLQMIEAMNKGKEKQQDGKIQEIQNNRKFKPWIDVSKTENGKLTAQLNNSALFKNDYVGYVKSLNDLYSRDLGQIQRNYMSSFKWIQKNHMFEIKHTPTCKKESLPINFDISEGYFILRIALDPKGAGANTQYQILNTSIPEEITETLDELLNNIHQAQSKNSNLEKIFKGAHDLIEKTKEVEREEEKKRQEEEERKKQLEQQKLEQGENEEDDEEDDDDEDYGDEEYDECEDPYFNQNDEENNDEDDEGEEGDDEEKKDPTIDLDLNMHCSLKDLQMRRIAHLRVNNIVVQVKCKSCKYDTELTLCNFLENTGENVLVNNLICVSCNRIAAIYCSREFVCGGDLNLAFRIGSFTWHILDIRQVSYNVTCEGCNTSKVVENYVSGTQHSSDCHSCFKNLSFVYFGFKIEKKIDEEYLNRVKKNAAKSKATSAISTRPKKIGTFKTGEPLPKNGACSHYRHSYRYFRFPCCGKAFPCDLCHDQAEKHEQIKAKSMVCGFCSREQSIKQECNGCKKMLVRIASNSGFWEGGKGTRNKAAMSNRDNHKFSGQSKTISRRKIKKESMQKK